ncbi:hypothetical protein [Blastococcus sp. TF02A-30]|uniref:hypothetical protein n=1 Tax=Blastococcus sp. TF02A-30 TaxID=2250580 RepID=UPI000DEBDFB6|nr:hypothetical protein [Blastococcus sp. TF02A-30]RBY86303.1 hypothetical protein DQ241_12120 [Blastococcus sp. TF02A-30]
MTLQVTHPPAAPPAAPPPAARPAPPRSARRLLAVVTDAGTAAASVDAALAEADRAGAAALHVAVVLPRTPFTLDAGLLARLSEEADRAVVELMGLVSRRTAGAAHRTTLSVHLVRGLRGRRRERVLDRLASRLARRLDAVRVGGPLR